MLSSAPLDSTRHTVGAFDSDEPGLDEWFKRHAQTSDARGVTRTFVWTEVDTTEVIGYYSLMAHVLQRDVLPRAVGRGSPQEIPAVLLARLALVSRAQGHGSGGALLADAAERACVAAENVGAKFLVVDALHEKAAGFYEHYGFRRVPRTLRLLQRISDIASAVRQA